MKKILIALIALIAVLSSVTAFAQFGVEGTSSPTYVVYPMRAGVSLKYTKIGAEAEYFLQLNTTNQFDGAMLIYLGNRDKARASLSQLLNELYELDKSYTLNDSIDKPFKAICSQIMGAKGYAIFKDGYAGNAFIRLKQISDMLEIM